VNTNDEKSPSYGSLDYLSASFLRMESTARLLACRLRYANVMKDAKRDAGDRVFSDIRKHADITLTNALLNISLYFSAVAVGEVLRNHILREKQYLRHCTGVRKLIWCSPRVVGLVEETDKRRRKRKKIRKCTTTQQHNHPKETMGFSVC